MPHKKTEVFAYMKQNNKTQLGGSTSARRRRTILLVLAFSLLALIYTVRFTIFQGQPSSHYDFHISPQDGDSRPASNVAVIIEGRPITNLAPLLLHFTTVLGPSWPVILYLTPLSALTLPTSAPFLRAVQKRRIEVRILPENITFERRDQVSAFLTLPWLWEDLAPAPHVLLFQADSIICANSEMQVEDFLRFDFVGAPISPTLGHGDMGMNGGFSLRNRTLMLSITKRFSWANERRLAFNPEHPPVAYEDQWFYAKMMRLNRDAAEDMEWDGTDVIRLPRMEEAMRFSVESIWYERPLGYHQVPHWHWNRVSEIDGWCPEHRMAISEKIRN